LYVQKLSLGNENGEGEKHKRRKIFSRKLTKYDAQRAVTALNFSFSLSDKSTGGLSWNLQVRLS